MKMGECMCVILLMIASVHKYCEGFLLNTNNSGVTSLVGQSMTDNHYIYVMDLIGQEKQLNNQNHQQIEQFLLTLQKDVEVMKQTMTANDQSREISALNNEILQLKNDNNRLQSQILSCGTETQRLKERLDNFTHSASAAQIKNATVIKETLNALNSKVYQLSSDSYARTQDFLALLNQTKKSQNQIDTLKKDSNMIVYMFESYKNSTSLRIEDAFNRLADINKTVVMTACSNVGSIQSGSVVSFSVIKTVYAVQGLDQFKNSGKFTCTVPGIYLFSASVTSNSYKAEYGMFKNNDAVSYVFIFHDTDPKERYHTGTGVVAVSLNIGDTLYIKSYRDMHVVGDHSCISIIKIR